MLKLIDYYFWINYGFIFTKKVNIYIYIYIYKTESQYLGKHHLSRKHSLLEFAFIGEKNLAFPIILIRKWQNCSKILICTSNITKYLEKKDEEDRNSQNTLLVLKVYIMNDFLTWSFKWVPVCLLYLDFYLNPRCMVFVRASYNIIKHIKA